MFEHIVLGAIQGITEWIPISSKACVIAAKVHLFHSQDNLNELINYALLLHLGTFFAAVIYFYKDISQILKSAFQPKDDGTGARKILVFLFLTTCLTALGQLIVTRVSALTYAAPHAKTALTSVIAALLMVAGFLQLKSTSNGRRQAADVKPIDGIILGLVQAMTTLPGLSRAGTTIAALVFRNFDKDQALKLSFLMSLPVILLGNIVKNHAAILSWGPQWAGVLSAFIVGILSISAIMSFARKINFGVFLIFIGSILTIAVLSRALD